MRKRIYLADDTITNGHDLVTAARRKINPKVGKVLAPPFEQRSA
jgi:hypothetical protein